MLVAVGCRQLIRLRTANQNLPAFVFVQHMDEKRPIQVQRAGRPMMSVDEDVPLHDLAVLRVEDVTDDSGNRWIDVWDVIAVNPTRIDGKPHIVLVQFNRRPPVGDNLASQIDVENEPPPHVKICFPAPLSTDRTTGFGDSPGHFRSLKRCSFLHVAKCFLSEKKRSDAPHVGTASNP